MNELAIEEMESSKEPIRQEASGCPLQSMHTGRTVLDANDELVFSTDRGLPLAASPCPRHGPTHLV